MTDTLVGWLCLWWIGCCLTLIAWVTIMTPRHRARRTRR